MAFRRFAFIVLIAASAGCSSPSGEQPASLVATNAAASAPTERKYLLERVDDAAVVQLYADGFSSLPLREKTLIWHLYQAALAGRDIFIDQKHRDALEMRDVLEQIVAHPQGVDAGDARGDPALHEAVLDQQRALQQPDRAQVRADAARRSSSPPRSRPRHSRRDVSHTSGRIARRDAHAPQPMFFDPNVDPIVTNKTPGAGKDILHRQRQQPVRRASRWPTSRASTSSTASTRAS